MLFKSQLCGIFSPKKSIFDEILIGKHVALIISDNNKKIN
jgi:hypothetical protein